jgi:murein DD-endopeptidase MepM/ murein hydrolase activator NlpD
VTSDVAREPKRFSVEVGDQVRAGTTRQYRNHRALYRPSIGPHLHFQTNISVDAADLVTFMRQRGIRL